MINASRKIKIKKTSEKGKFFNFYFCKLLAEDDSPVF